MAETTDTPARFEPELLQSLLGAYSFPHRSPDLVGNSIISLAQEIVAAHPEIYPVDEPEIADEDGERYYDEWTPLRAAASELFTHWGSGWYENDTFLLHGYTYDDSCVCGAWPQRGVEDTTGAALRALPLDWFSINSRDVRARLCVCEEVHTDYIDLIGPEQPLPPNFVFKTDPFAVAWYKHPHRGASISRKLEPRELHRMMAACTDSLHEPPTYALDTQKQWPPYLARKRQHALLIETLQSLPADAVVGFLGLA